MFFQSPFQTWSPLREMERIQAQMQRLMREAGPEEARTFPPIDLWANDETWTLRALVPGAAREDLEVSVVGDTLTLRGSLPAQALEENESWHREERSTGRFARTLQLPFAVDPDGVKARCKDGVLEVDLPRAASDKPRKIAVTAG